MQKVNVLPSKLCHSLATCGQASGSRANHACFVQGARIPRSKSMRLFPKDLQEWQEGGFSQHQKPETTLETWCTPLSSSSASTLQDPKDGESIRRGSVNLQANCYIGSNGAFSRICGFHPIRSTLFALRITGLLFHAHRASFATSGGRFRSANYPP